MARKKSFNDISHQTERLFHTALWKQNNSSRARKIGNISKRYLDNIRNSKWGKSMFAKKDSLIKEGHRDKEIELGKIGIKYGKAHASSARIHLTINGTSAHAALPHKGVDAILIGAKVMEFLQSIVSRRIDPREESVITIGAFNGGFADNVVCDKVEMKGTARTMSEETRTFIIETIEKDLPKFVESLGGTVNVDIKRGYAPVINNEEMTKRVENNIVDLYSKNALELIKQPRMDVEDVSYFLNEIPGCFFRLGTRVEEKGLIYDLHHPKFNIDEESLKIGMGLQLKNILEYLK